MLLGVQLGSEDTGAGESASRNRTPRYRLIAVAVWRLAYFDIYTLNREFETEKKQSFHIPRASIM